MSESEHERVVAFVDAKVDKFKLEEIARASGLVLAEIVRPEPGVEWCRGRYLGRIEKADAAGAIFHEWPHPVHIPEFTFTLQPLVG